MNCAKLGVPDHVCCPSCHEDVSEGWSDPIDYEKDGKWYGVCCRAATWLDEKARS